MPNSMAYWRVAAYIVFLVKLHVESVVSKGLHLQSMVSFQQPTPTSERPSAKTIVKCMYSFAGSQAPTLRHLGARARHFHNLTELAAEALQPDEALVANAARRGSRARPQLPDTVAPGTNMAMFQVLPSTCFMAMMLE